MRKRKLAFAALLAALADGRVGAAALDCFHEEPLPRESPFWALPNLLITPHAAGGDVRSLRDMTTSAAEAIAALRRGEWPAEKVVNPEVRAKFKW